MPPAVRFKDLAREWNVSVVTVRRWVRVHRLKVLRPSKRTLLVPVAEADKLWKKVGVRWTDLPPDEISGSKRPAEIGGRAGGIAQVLAPQCGRK